MRDPEDPSLHPVTDLRRLSGGDADRASLATSVATITSVLAPVICLLAIGTGAAGGVLRVTSSASADQGPPRRPSGRAYPVAFTLVDSGQEIGSFASWSVSLADADGDGDLDAFLSNWHPSHSEYSQLWLNDGSGTFVESSQRLPSGQTTMSPGDLDGDGDVDIWFGGHVLAGQADGQVWLNDGQARFSRTDQSPLTGNNALGDLDGDGDLDAMVVNYYTGVRVYLNDGHARFASAGDLDQRSPGSLALADLDGDGDLDAYVASVSDDTFVSRPDRVWFNDGHAGFTDSGQTIGEHQGISVALGDVDGDGDIDALVGNAHDAPDPANPARPFKLWLNDGSGYFSDSGQDLGEVKEGAVALADLDSDGDLDAVLFNREPISESGPNRVLINHGRGHFADWGIEFEDSATPSGAVADLDGDGDLDVFCANAGIEASQANRVWINQPARLTDATPPRPGELASGAEDLPPVQPDPRSRRASSRRIPVPRGDEIAFATDRTGNYEVAVLAIGGGEPTRLTDHPDTDGFPAWSPDGGRIAFYAYHGADTWSIHVMARDGSGRQRLTHREGVHDFAPEWSPEGSQIAFSSENGGHNEIWVMNADGSSQRRLTGLAGFGPSWSPDGQRLVYVSQSDGDTEICVAGTDGVQQGQLTVNEGEDMWPDWSPDGRRVAFMSDRDGSFEIYVMDSDGSNQRRVTHNEVDDYLPDWSPDGRWIVFASQRDDDLEIMLTDVTGSYELRLTDDPAVDSTPAWRPVR